MKKLMIIISMMLLTSGCNLVGRGNTDSSTSSAISSTPLDSSVKSTSSVIKPNQPNSKVPKGSPSPEEAGAIEDIENVDSAVLKPTADEIRLVPQKADRENGFTLETDPVLQEIDERMRQAETVGIPNDVAIHFTRIVLNETEETQVVFILVNLTNSTMKNIKMTISFSNTENEIILDKALFDLSEDRFGLFEPNTAMPVYIDIPEDTKEIVNQLKDFKEMNYSIDSFKYEEI